MSVRRPAQKIVLPQVQTASNLHREDLAKPWRSSFLSMRKRSALLSVFLMAGVFFSIKYVLDDISIKSAPGSKKEDTMKTLNNNEKLKSDRCTIWLGASSLKGHPGMGVYTTRHISKGSEVLPSGDGIAIPLYGFHLPVKSPNKKARQNMMEVWMYYVWSANKPDHISYEEYGGMSSYFPGYASLTNHHCTLKSLRQRYIAPFYDDSLLNRFEDVGAGAFSYDKGRGNIVNRDVQAGEELFLNYGYCEHGNSHKGTEWTEFTFMPEDFRAASALIFDLLWKSLRVESGKLVFDSASKLPDVDNRDNLVTQLLPKDGKELLEMKSHAETLDELTWYLAQHKGLNYHDPEWIQSNGICLENFISGKSTIRQAGNGGIAKLQINKGEIIVPVPLLQIMDKDALTIYDNTKSSDNEWKEVGKQLLLNYCWGHPDSPLLLCPQTNAVLLNHCSNRTKECGPKGPNAIVRWASGWHRSTQTWLEMSLDEMAKEPTGGLAFDIVSSRDILPGEEIFIDYGVEWEKAWENHVQNWHPPVLKSHFNESWISVKEANENLEETLEKLMIEDLRKPFEHPYLFTACRYHKSKPDYSERYLKEDKDWKNHSDKKLIQLYASDGQHYSAKYEKGYAFHKDHSYWPCNVFKKDSAAGTYTVRIMQSPFEDDLPWEENHVPRFLTNYSLKGIRFFVNPYKSDQHLRNVFRHPIGIPSEIFPEQWKIRKK